MKTPTTYAAWVDCLDRFKTVSRQENDLLDTLYQGELKLSAGVAGRFADQMNHVIQYRLGKAADKFSRAMDTTGGDSNLFVRALLDLRKEFHFLIRFARIPVLPKEFSEQLVAAIQSNGDTMQKSLEENASRTDRTGALSSLLRRNRVNAWEEIL